MVSLQRGTRSLRISAVAVPVFLLLFLAACGSGSTASSSSSSSGGGLPSSATITKIQSAGTIRIGVVDSPPWLIGDATTGTWTGPGNDVAAAVAKKLGVKIDYVTTTFGTFVAGLQANQFDMFVAPANATPARLAVVDMTNYSVDGTCYAVKQSNTTVNSLSDLNSPSVTFGFFQGIATTDQVKAKYPNAKSVTRQAVAGSPGDIQSVESGIATAAPFDSVFATVVQSQFPDLKIIPPVSTCLATPDLVIPTAVAYTKDAGFDQLVKQITQQITPQIQADYAKYSGSKYLGKIPG